MSQRIPSRAENRALKAHLENNAQEIPSPLTPPLSAFIDRRELDHRTEAQLKAACAAVVKGEVIPDETPVLNIYRPLHQTKSVPHLPIRNNNGSSRPQTAKHQTSNNVDSSVPPVPMLTKANRPVSHIKSSQDLAQVHGRQRQNTTVDTHIPRRAETRSQPQSATEARKPTTFLPPSLPRARTVPVEESDGSYATPRTTSTDRYLDNVSTGFTSTAITPSRPLQRVSGQLLVDHAPPKDTHREQARRRESAPDQRREKRSSNTSDQPPRPESRSRFRDWISRPSSRGGVRPNTAVAEPPLRRATSTERFLGRSRRSSNQGHSGITMHHDNSSKTRVGAVSAQGFDRPNLEGTHFEDRPGSELNLNRPLPRLPGLDTWNKHNDAETVKSEPTPTTLTMPQMHVVDLMKATALRSAPIQTSLHEQAYHKEIAIIPIMEHSKEIAANMGRRISANHSHSSSTADSCFSQSRSRAQSGSLAQIATVEHIRSPAKSHHARISDAPTAYSIGSQPSLSRSGAISSISETSIPNFSRKISIDSHGGIRSQEVTALPQMPPTPKPKGLRRVLSSFQLVNVQIGVKRKTVQGGKGAEGLNWMDRFEKEGIKTGVMVTRGNGAAAAPIVRY